MKNLLSITVLAILVFILSCGEDHSNNGGENTLTHLKLNQSKQYIPYAALTQNSKAIFVNAEGSIRELTIHREQFEVDKTLDGKNYTAEQDQFRYIDPNNSEYSIGVNASTSYQEGSVVQELLNSSLYNTLNNGYIAMIMITGDGNQSVGFFNSEIELNGQMFRDVYSSLIIEDQGFVYNGLYYTKEQGVVGFLDSQNELWSLDRFEE